MAYDRVVDSIKLDNAMTATANIIREKLNDPRLIEWDENTGFRDSVEDVADACRSTGFGEGKDAAYEEISGLNDELEQTLYGVDTGGKSFYDLMWDALQHDGVDYISHRYAFANADMWNQENIERIKYKNLRTNYFSVVFIGNSAISDLSAFSFETELYPWGERARITLASTFAECENLQKCMVIDFDYVSSFANTFNYCSALQSVPVKGTLQCNGLSFASCPLLDKSTIVNVMNCASDTLDLTITFNNESINKAFETSEGANDGSTSADWLALIATRPNVTILYA